MEKATTMWGTRVDVGCFVFQAQITNAMVASIYQQELAKMAGQPPVPPGGAVHTPTPPQQPPPSQDAAHAHSTASRARAAFPGSKRSDSIDSNCSGGGGGRGRRIQTDDKNLSEEMVSRIYREELMKLARQAQKSGNPAEFTMYQQELQRLAAEANKKGYKPHSQVNQARLEMTKVKIDFSFWTEVGTASCQAFIVCSRGMCSPLQMNGHLSPQQLLDGHDPDQPQDLSTKIKQEPRATPDTCADASVAEDLSNKENIRR